jgi:hypothetical protein
METFAQVARQSQPGVRDVVAGHENPPGACGTIMVSFRNVKAEHIREFLNRPRQQVESLKAEWWASHAAADGHGSALDVGHAVLEHARQLDASFPSPDRASQALVRR